MKRVILGVLFTRFYLYNWRVSDREMWVGYSLHVIGDPNGEHYNAHVIWGGLVWCAIIKP